MTPFVSALLVMLAGVALAWLGGEWFVRGAVGLARWKKWPPSVIGATVAAFGTSSPELMVGIHAAKDGTPAICLGDVLGSNVVNISLVLAIAMLMLPLRMAPGIIRRDLLPAFLVPIAIGLVLIDGVLSRLDAVILLLGFSAWLYSVLGEARREAAVAVEDLTEAGEVPGSAMKAFGFTLAGLLVLLGAAKCVVHGGTSMATILGWSPFVVGALVVAVATGTPELATTIISSLRGHHEVGLGAILGSNIFNALFIAPVAALICPIQVQFATALPALVVGVVTTMMLIPGTDHMLGRRRAVALMVVYVGFLAYSFMSGAGHVAP